MIACPAQEGPKMKTPTNIFQHSNSHSVIFSFIFILLIIFLFANLPPLPSFVVFINAITDTLDCSVHILSYDAHKKGMHYCSSDILI